MPFQKGNKLGAKGRPQGSKNKTTDRNKDVLHELLYNPEDMITSFKTLDAYKQWDIRCKFAGKFFSSPVAEIEMDIKNLPISIDMETGEHVDLETQLELREKYGDEPPLFINYDHNGETTKK
jgi:hypothetical protein